MSGLRRRRSVRGPEGAAPRQEAAGAGAPQGREQCDPTGASGLLRPLLSVRVHLRDESAAA